MPFFLAMLTNWLLLLERTSPTTYKTSVSKFKIASWRKRVAGHISRTTLAFGYCFKQAVIKSCKSKRDKVVWLVLKGEGL